MLAYAKGDMAAFEQLYGQYKDPLFRFFLRQCGNQALAEELYQDVWVRVINARERYAAKARFSTWLYRIAHNILVDYYRKPVEEALPDDEHDAPSMTNEDPEYKVSSQEKLNRYRTMLRALPDEQREVFLMKQEGGLGLNEISEITGENTEALKSRLRYAVAKLKRALMESEDNEQEQQTYNQ